MEVTQMSIGRWMGKQNVVGPCTRFYAAVRRNGVPTRAASWRSLGNTMPSERGQTQKATHHTIPFTQNVQSREIHRDREQTGSPGPGMAGTPGQGDESVLKLTGDGATNLQSYWKPLNCTL